MRAVRFPGFVLAFLLAAAAVHADDLGKIVRACGPPAERTVWESPDGWLSFVEYRPGGVPYELTFVGRSREGPWVYYSATDARRTTDRSGALLAASPCMRAAGVIGEAGPVPLINATTSRGKQATPIAFGVFLIAVYLLPAMVAAGLNHKSRGRILAVDLLLGWTLIGWMVALAWALHSEPGSHPVPAPHR